MLDGAAAVVIAVDRQARVSIKPHKEKSSRLNAAAIDVHNLSFEGLPSGDISLPTDADASLIEKLAFFRACYQISARQLSRDGLPSIPAAGIELDTSAFFHEALGIKLGFGSSAALSVATIAALFASAKAPLTSRQCFELALEAHHLAQGKMGSGIDIAASAFGGILRYRIADHDDQLIRETTPLQLPNDLHMRFVWTGKSASTRILVGKVRDFEQRDPDTVSAIFRDMSAISDGGIHALVEGQTEHFLEAVDAYYQAMDRLGQHSGADIISAEHRQIADIALRHHCRYKPSGAGGGDFGILFGQNEQEIENSALQISRAGFKLITLAIVDNGVTTSDDKDS